MTLYHPSGTLAKGRWIDSSRKEMLLWLLYRVEPRTIERASSGRKGTTQTWCRDCLGTSFLRYNLDRARHDERQDSETSNEPFRSCWTFDSRSPRNRW